MVDPRARGRRLLSQLSTWILKRGLPIRSGANFMAPMNLPASVHVADF